MIRGAEEIDLASIYEESFAALGQNWSYASKVHLVLFTTPHIYSNLSVMNMTKNMTSIVDFYSCSFAVTSLSLSMYGDL